MNTLPKKSVSLAVLLGILIYSSGAPVLGQPIGKEEQQRRHEWAKQQAEWERERWKQEREDAKRLAELDREHRKREPERETRWRRDRTRRPQPSGW